MNSSSSTAELDRPRQDTRRHQTVLEISSAAPGRAAVEHLIEIDPRPCGICGLTIDRHIMVDGGEGPEFYCDEDLTPDEMTLPELERRAELRRQEDVAAILAAMDAAPRHRQPPAAAPEPYSPAASTVDAFWLVASGRDTARLRAWVLDRPEDAPFLLKLLESK